MNASLRILSSKAGSNTCESFRRSELKLKSVLQELPRSDIFRKRATKPLLKQKHRQKRLTWAKKKKNWTVSQWSKVLFSDKSTFSISFGNQGPRVWRKRGEEHKTCCLKSSVKFLQSVMIWAAMSSLVLVHCVFRSPQSTQPSTTSCFLPLTSFMEMLISFYGDADFITSMPRRIDAVIHAKISPTKYWVHRN